MRRVSGVLLILFCGLLLVVELVAGLGLITGRARFGGGGLAIEYVAYFALLAFSTYGVFAGVRISGLAHSDAQEVGTDRRHGSDRAGRTVGALIGLFGLGCFYTAATAVPSHPDLYRFLGIPGAVCTVAGGILLFIFRDHRAKRPTGG